MTKVVTYDVQVLDDDTNEWRTLRTFTDYEKAKRYYQATRDYHSNKSCRVLQRTKYE